MKNGLTLGLSALALCAAGVAYAGSRTAAQIEREAREDAVKATKAIAKRDGAAAVQYAEYAVSLQPQDAGYRSLLGQAYLAAGRFASAKAAFTDSLTLSPGDPRVALNLSLAQIADGDWSGARATLDRHSGTIPVADRGLAMALAGDPAGAVDLLLPIARQPGANAKLRQNLALSLALAGRWQDARLVASMDLSPADLDKRIEQWAAFARPTGRADQVASLLGVSPASDPGQPVALALNAAVPVAPVAVASAPVETAPPAPAPVIVAAQAPASVVAVAATPRIVFGPRAEVVQALPGRVVATPGKLAKPVAAPVKNNVVKTEAVATPTPGAVKVSVRPVVGKGNFFVQLGAYDSVGVARDDWSRASRRYSAFAGQTPQGMNFTAGGKSFYRLSVGGFDEAGAKRLCAGYRAHGGKCFVRTGAGEKSADWSKK
ncbi:MAG: tetratricopeptide repeat protein [Sphingomonas sp.]|uniref:SPOR domain-containing protein n=1 Tax=Sphingomonas sp. TaxID=28214 RepID=UPI001AC8C0E2|nr:SPOR domain-containing protein [Sphingomonas sp.]MBN8807611.1 tetratricopeptide repeat protein [Sphingomonas sp.]